MSRPSLVTRITELQGTDFVPMDRPASTIANSTTLEDVRAFATGTYVAAALYLADHRVITMQGQYADCTILAHAYALAGVTTAGTAQGLSAHAQASGEITDLAWNWTVGSPIYLGNNGFMTQMVPTGAFISIIGRPVTATTLLIDIQPPIITA